MPHRDPSDIDPALSDAVRRTYVRPVDEAVAERHLAAIAAAARESVPPANEPARRRRRAWRPALAAGLAALLVPAGLAAAGVRLPAAVDAPYEVIGVTLPNQDDDETTTRPVVPRPGRRVVPPSPTPSAITTPPASTATPGSQRSERGSERGRGDTQGRRRATRKRPGTSTAPALPPQAKGTPQRGRPATPPGQARREQRQSPQPQRNSQPKQPRRTGKPAESPSRRPTQKLPKAVPPGQAQPKAQGGPKAETEPLP